MQRTLRLRSWIDGKLGPLRKKSGRRKKAEGKSDGLEVKQRRGEGKERGRKEKGRIGKGTTPLDFRT